MSVLQTTRFRMPAEWHRHERTLMSWPTAHPVWGGRVADARLEYATVAKTIARYEPVLVVADPGDASEAAKQCGAGVDVVALPIDDAWLRDSGPLIVFDVAGARTGMCFAFNAYGGRFVPYDSDASIAERVLGHLRIDVMRSPLVLEGGSIAVDGEGTLIATEQCLLNANRNPGWTRAEIEAELRERLGAERIIWLRWGRIEDEHTDGHVDVVCMFVRPGVVVVQGCDDTSNPNYARLAANLRVLRESTDALGRNFEIIELPMQPLVLVSGRSVLVSNVNSYVCNGAVIVPVADAESGDGVLEIIRRAMPDRDVVGVRAQMIGFGGGGIHCVTQQIPVAS